MIKKLLCLLAAAVLVSFNSFVYASAQDLQSQVTSENTNTGESSSNANSTNIEGDLDADLNTDINNENSQTGANSENNNTQNINLSDPENQTTVTSEVTEGNTTDLGIDTGSNTVEHSTLIEEFSTGDISGQITAIKSAGNTLAEGSQVEVKTSSEDNLIDLNDFNSMDTSFDISSSQSTPDNSNQFFVLNSEDLMNLDLNTGENSLERNSIIEQASTGDIDFATNLVNLFALNDPELLLTLQVYTILGDLMGDISIEDEFLNEEPLYTAQVSANSAQSQTTINSNSNFQMNTGENEFDMNTVSGDVATGDAAAGYFQNDFGGLLDKANFFIVNVLGDWIGTNFLADHDNVLINTLLPANESSGQSCDTDSENIINIDKTLTANANTGRNSFKQNTIVGKLTTGHINLLENVVNFKDTLVSLRKKLNIRVVNILGNFRGNVVKAAKTTPPTGGNGNGNGDGGSSQPGATEQPKPDQSISPELGDNRVLGVSEEVKVAQASEAPGIQVAQSANNLNPGLIEAGANSGYLAYLLLLLPTLIVYRLLKHKAL